MKNDHLFQRYGTHLPYLWRATNLTTGPILELGAGIYSTLSLHYGILDRQIYTLESNPNWLDGFLHLQSDNHHFLLVDNWDTPFITSRMWGVVFIDHGPDSRRQTEVVRVKDTAQIVVVHDTEDHFNVHHYDFSMYKYKKEFTDISHCHTTLLSNFQELQ